MELATVVASFAVIVEIFRGSVRHNPGIVRFIQNALLMAFGITAFYVCLSFSYGGLTSIFRGIEQLGRDLRFVEGGLVIALLWLLVRYRITLGRNLLGLIVGYSFWIGINLTDFAFLPAPGDETSRFLRVIVPASYAVTLAVWCTTLWSAQPEPAQSASQLEHDYEYFAAKTRDLIARTSDSVTRVMKP
jgi:multisubunit Na+/H+ antiporter MnhE subunit